MNYFEFFLKKSRKALAEYSASAFLAGTKALAECSSIRRLPSYLPGRHSANICRTFVDGLPGRYEGHRRIDEHSASAFVPARKAIDEYLPSIRQVPS